MKKSVLAISVIVMLLSLLIAGCDLFGSKSEEPIPELTLTITPEPTPEPTPERVADEFEEIIEEDEEEEEEQEEPEETKWGPLAAEFLDLLATRNYYLKFYSTGASMDPDGDVTVEPDPIIFEFARQDDVYAYAASDTWDEDKLFLHLVHIDNRMYSIKHEKRLIIIDEFDWLDASDDKDDFFPVSYMEFIESGVGSVDRVSTPYEDYAIAGSETIIRIYIDGTEVAYMMMVTDGRSSFIRTNFEVSAEIPSYMLELPDDYTVEDNTIPAR